MYKSFLSIFCLILSLIGCQNNTECVQFIDEEYPSYQIDSLLSKGFSNYRDTLLNRFNETPIKNLNHTTYQLFFYSSHGYGKSVKFEKTKSGYFLTTKCTGSEHSIDKCISYNIKIDPSEWEELENLIYEFDYWTEEPFRATEGVLDGYVFILEAKRPEAKRCNKKTYQFIGRDSPSKDKIGSLCNEILNFESQLDFQYHQ